MREWIAVIAGVLALAYVNAGIWGKEKVVRADRVVLLALAPVDPRSLMQGDYMALRFAAAQEIGAAGSGGGWPSRRRAVFALDAQGVGHFVRHDDGTALQPGEVLLRYRVRDGQVEVGSSAFFFQEGTGARYAVARYGELRVDGLGEAVLTGLRDAQRRPIEAPR
jgi:uncharacterized membrane-anchored protein